MVCRQTPLDGSNILSFHKPSVFDAIPIGLAHMIRSICADRYVKSRLDAVKCDLMAAGFNIHKLNKAMKPFYTMDRRDCRSGKYKEYKGLIRNKNFQKLMRESMRTEESHNMEQSLISMVDESNLSSLNTSTSSINGNVIVPDVWVSQKWHPGVANMRKVINKHLHILHCNKDLEPHFPPTAFNYSYKRYENLWEALHPLKFQRIVLREKQKTYEERISDRFNPVRISGEGNIHCNGKHILKRMEANTNEIMCRKCEAHILSTNTIFGCTECGVYVCNLCVNFNCIGNHDLSPINEEKICDLCDEDMDNGFGCAICDFDVCIECINTKFKYNPWLDFNHLSLKSFYDTRLINASDDVQNRKGQTFKSEPCESSARCKSCGYIQSTNSITSKTFGIKYKLQGKNNCLSSNGIYAIECKNCKDQYIGSTIQTFRSRQNGHRGGIRNAKVNLCEMYRHFNSYPCNGGQNEDNLHNYSFVPIKTIRLKGNAPEDILYNEYCLNRDEREWQARLGTIHSGLNGTADWSNCNELRRHKALCDKIPRLLAVEFV
eukprot:214231_1